MKQLDFTVRNLYLLPFSLSSNWFCKAIEEGYANSGRGMYRGDSGSNIDSIMFLQFCRVLPFSQPSHGDNQDPPD